MRSGSYIADYCDASLSKSHELFRDHCGALQLIIYFDEVEVCNPLGAQRGIHKLGVCVCACDYVYQCKLPTL